MRLFSSILKSRREELGLSREDLAKKIVKTASYISALENQNQDKSPSVETLAVLVRILAAKNPEIAANTTSLNMPDNYVMDEEVARSMIEAALALHSPLVKQIVRLIDPDQEIRAQSVLNKNAEVWVISDLLAEASESVVADTTARNIHEKKVHYSFFVPPSIPKSHWQRAISRIKESLGTQHDHMIDEYVRVFELSECAFGCRMRITNPLSADPDGSYSIGGTVLRTVNFVQVSRDLLLHVIRALSELCKQLEATDTTSVIVVQECGTLRQLFPSNRRHRKKRPRNDNANR